MKDESKLNLGVIAARGGSKGLPRKNVRLLRGVPLIVYSVKAARESLLLHDFLVSTDDPSIADVARSAGANVPFLRPEELARDESSIWLAVAHAVEFWERTTGRRADAVVLLQATSPFRVAKDIDGAIEHFWHTDADLCVSAAPAHDNPYFNMVEEVPGANGLVQPCTEAMTNGSRRQDVRRVLSVNGAVYVVRPRLLPLENQFKVPRLAAYGMPTSRSIDIDSVEDFEFAEWLLSKRET